MLLTTVVLWALNLTVTRYILTHGFEPLAYATVRYGLATAIFIAIVLVGERTLRIARRDLPLAALAALFIFLNQLSFVYALEKTTASTIALILGATPVFAAVIGLALGLERLSRRFWIAAAISFAGVGLVALGERRGLRRPPRRPARDRDGRHLGGLLRRGRAADAAVLGVADQRRRARARLARDPRRRLPAGGGPGPRRRLEGLAAARLRHARPARPDDDPLVPRHPPDRRLARHARREPAAVRRRGLRARPPLRADDAAPGRRRAPDRAAGS